MEDSMAIAPKAALHRLVEAIPDTQPEVANVLIDLGARLIVASQNDEHLFRRLLSDLADMQASANDPEEQRVRVEDLRNRYLQEADAPVGSLPEVLESAPDDDEPLTAEEVAMLDARHASAKRGSTISDDELSRLLDP